VPAVSAPAERKVAREDERVNVDIEAALRRIADLERQAADLGERQDPTLREEFERVVEGLVNMARGLVLVVDNVQKGT